MTSAMSNGSRGMMRLALPRVRLCVGALTQWGARVRAGAHRVGCGADAGVQGDGGALGARGRSRTGVLGVVESFRQQSSESGTSASAGQMRGMEVKGLLGVLMDGCLHVCVRWGVSRALGAFSSVLQYVKRESGMSGAACGEGMYMFRRGEGGD